MGLDRVVAGIDIGGDRKGCHLAILKGTRILRVLKGSEPEHMLQACIDAGVVAVGIDAPCQWASEQQGRHAEKVLAQQRIFSFATPTRERAKSNASGFYGWMFNGERVYETFFKRFALFKGGECRGEKICFETFPHAITCAMLGREIASARQKRLQRRRILETAGVETAALKSIDEIDAALCALTARFLLEGKTHAYGDESGGYIVVPVFDG